MVNLQTKEEKESERSWSEKRDRKENQPGCASEAKHWM
jgi:hypothetical protein